MTTQIDLEQLQSDLPLYLNQVEAGDTLIVCKNQQPIAEIRPIGKRRPVGLAEGKITIHPSFYDPLPEDIVAGFEGNPQ
jgi:antitoxin (DNA-binding transcriptional repressor) of toxin-antitoxin stability system